MKESLQHDSSIILLQFCSKYNKLFYDFRQNLFDRRFINDISPRSTSSDTKLIKVRIFVGFQTYNMDAQVGESSACATALLCGVKANYETVGLDSSARFENCYSSYDAHVPSLINWAQEQGE